MTIIEAAPQPELVRRATDLVDLIRKHAPWQEENRVLHDEVVNALNDAGLLKMRVPARFGGSLPDVRTVVSVVAELARGDGSVGWTFSTWTIGAWMAGLFPDEVQDEFFATPDVRFCGSVGPNGIAVPTDDGYVLNGNWHFNTGAQQSQWDLHTALVALGDDNYAPCFVAVPVSELTIVDDWHTVGLRGTGSVTTIAKDVFVPKARLIPLMDPYQSATNADYQVWQVPFLPFAVSVAGSPGLGIARAAWEAFFERLPDRKITYTNYERQIEAPLTHLQVAEAAVKIDEAEFHLHRQVERLDSKTLSGEEWTLADKAAARVDAAAVCLRGKDAVDVLNTASGGSSIYSHNPMQRIERDIQTLNLHGIMHMDTVAETYGRVLCGLEPNTTYL